MSRAVIIHPPFIEALRQAPALPLGGAIERAGAFIALFLFSQGLVGPLFADPADPESSVVLRLIWLPVYAITLVFMALHPGRTVGALLRSPAILALAALTLLSVMWSVAPDVSLRRGFALFMTTLFGLWLASRWDWSTLITLIAAVFASLAVASTLMAVLMPSLGVDQAVHAGAWKGVWWEKNTLGAMMAWGTIAALAALNNDPRRAWIWAGAAVLCSALVVLSTSKTALLAWALGCGLVALVGFCRQGFGFAVMCLTLAVCGFALAVLILLIAPLDMLELLMAVLMPSLGVDQAVHAGAWKGVWWEKNTLGAMMAWGTIAALAALNNDPRRAWIWAGAAVLCSALVVLSTSKTALLAWALGCGLVALVGFCRQGFGFAVMCLTLAVCGFALAVLILLIAPLDMLELLGRDATLTGRTEIWAVLIREVQTVPWTGYGYNAFWAADSGPVFWVRQETAWDVPTAHNGWIETALAIGLPGVLLMALVYLRAVSRALGRMFTGGEAYWALPFLAMFGLVSISESNLMEQNGLSWVLFVATAAALARRRA